MKYNNEGLENIFFESVCKLREDYYFMQNISGRVRWSPKAVNDFELPGEYVDGFAGMWRSFIHPEDLASMKKWSVYGLAKQIICCWNTGSENGMENMSGYAAMVL